MLATPVSYPLRVGLALVSDFFFVPLEDLLNAAAARTSVLKAASSRSSPSRMSIARRVLPSRLELNSRDGSASEAPFAKVSLTALL